MRANVAEYDLIAPANLPAALALLAENPGRYTPIAGGTELMVALSAGRLAQRQLLSLHKLSELRFIDVLPESVTIGAGATFTDLWAHAVIAADFPLLAQAASWTGSIANQNRGTIGGNIVNASPAADSPPALLAYDARVTMVSTRGARTVPYEQFHVSYKKTVLAEDELLFSVTLPRRFHAHHSYIRKVGTRNAQAISKIALAGVVLVADGKIAEVRLGAASLREVPARCFATEKVLLGGVVADGGVAALIASARAALASEARPIDDIRSTAKYRAAVAGNLLEEFVRQLAQ